METAEGIHEEMSWRRKHAWFLVIALSTMPLASWAILSHQGRLDHVHLKALTWAIVSTGIHGILGWRLWKKKTGTQDSGIASGLVVLALRFISGAGLFATGIVANPEAKLLFVLLWTGMFLILIVSESIFFIQGVQEL